MKIILASTSPRRQEMLSWLGIKFDAVAPTVDESVIRHNDPKKLTQLLAEAKAEAVRDGAREGIIIGSDAIVCFNDQILEKAKDKNHQRELIKAQRGKNAATVSSICIINLATNEKVIKTKVTEYAVADVTDEQIEAYVESGKGMDKAGGFGLQDENGMFVKEILGCYPNVIGFPVCEVAEILSNFGVPMAVDIKSIVHGKTGYEC